MKFKFMLVSKIGTKKYFVYSKTANPPGYTHTVITHTMMYLERPDRNARTSGAFAQRRAKYSLK